MPTPSGMVTAQQIEQRQRAQQQNEATIREYLAQLRAAPSAVTNQPPIVWEPPVIMQPQRPVMMPQQPPAISLATAMPLQVTVPLGAHGGMKLPVPTPASQRRTRPETVQQLDQRQRAQQLMEAAAASAAAAAAASAVAAAQYRAQACAAPSTASNQRPVAMPQPPPVIVQPQQPNMIPQQQPPGMMAQQLPAIPLAAAMPLQQPVMGQPVMTQQRQMEVKVPPGAHGGMMLPVPTPAGVMKVQIPQGLTPGMAFMTVLPANPAWRMPACNP
jgi:hypothetical protein